MTGTVAPDVLQAARETWALERAADASFDDSLEAALAAGIRAQEQRFRARIADEAETYAREAGWEVEEGEDGEPAYAVALAWFASKVREGMDLDPSTEYEPEDGDVVELTVVGGFAITPKRKGATLGWSVTDDYTGLEFVMPFASGIEPQIRVLSRAKEQAPTQLSGEGQEDQ